MDTQTLLLAAAGATGGGDTDPNFNQTVLLLHGDGSNGAQNNTFLDSSTNNFTITRNGNPTQGSFSPFGRTSGNLDDAYDPAVNGGSGYFDGSGDYLSIADNAALEIGASQFCIEMFVYLNALPASGSAYTLISKFGASGARSWLLNAVNNAGTMELLFAYTTNGSTVLSLTQVNASGLTANAWHHVAVTRDGSNNFRYFLDGTQCGSTIAFSATIANTTQPIEIGRHGAGIQYINGHVSNCRFVIGDAVYTSAFTPPTAPLTAIANTSLLCNFTNAGIFDQTGKNNLETVGNAQIDTTTKKYGTGSMEFDGTGDWLKVPNSPDLQLGTGDFTIEFWVYLASGDTGSARGLVAKGGASTGWLVSLDSSEKVVFTYTTSTITSSGAITTNAWNHIAVVREGTGSNETKIYIGGTNDGTGTVSTDFNQTSVMYVGANRTGGDPMKGLVDDLRITKGVARYTTTFTPPTKAFPDL